MKINNNNETVKMIDGGEVNVVKTPGLTDITIDELLLPNLQKYPFARYEGVKNNEIREASYYLEKLRNWKKKRAVVEFNIIRKKPASAASNGWASTAMMVTIESYEIIEDASQGFDVKVKLTLKENREWGAKKFKRPTYVVQKGDTLMKIAKKTLGKSSKWERLYEVNKKTIEKAANEHGKKSSSKGKRLYPGTALKIPLK
ncbi:LysM peptidoglycan-binding domain-containing protein [Lachnospiraceae bacterium 46-15]